MFLRSVGVIIVLGASVAGAAPSFTGDTTNPDNGCFVKGSEAKALFAAKGFEGGRTLPFVVRFFDGEENELTDWSVNRVVTLGADGGWTGSVVLPTVKYGFFRLRATLGAETLPAVGSRPRGCLTYLVTMDPKERRLWTEDDHFLGIHGDLGGKARLAPWIGARWTLRGLGPYASEAEYRKARADMDADGWTYFGFYSPQLTHWYPDATWTAADRAWWEKNRKNQWNYFSDPEGREVYRRVIQGQVKRSLGQPFYTRERIWETMWEPELSAKPEVLLDAVRYSTACIKEIDPEAKIAIPTVSGMKKLDFYQKIFKLGILDYADVFDMHFYSDGMPPEENGYLRRLRAIVKLVREHSARNLPMIATEGGYNTKAVKAEEFKQMTGVTRMLLILLGEGFKFGLPFYGTDYGGDYADRAEGDWGMTYNLELPKRRFGARKVSPRPILAAVSGLGMMVDGARPTACLDYLGETALGYAYQHPDGEVTLALWCWGDKMTEVELPVGVERVRVGDLYGNVVEQATKGGIFRATLSPKPIYVKGVAAAIWGKNATRAVMPEKASCTAVAGGRVVLRGTVDRAGTLEVRPSPMTGIEAFSRAVAKGGFEVALDLPALLKDGDYPVLFALREKGRLVSLAGTTLTVEAPVRMTAATACFREGRPAVALTLENMTDDVREGVAAARVIGEPESRTERTVRLAPRETRTVHLVATGWKPSPFRVFEERITFTASNGHRTEQVKNVNFLSAQQAPGVGQGGDFAAWRPTWIDLPRDIRRNAEYTKDGRDLSAKMALGWNETYMLLGFEVTDDDHVMPERDAWWIWRGDAVQFAFAKDVLLKLSENVWADALDQAATENVIALTAKGVQVARTVSYDPTRYPCDITGDACLIRDVPSSVTKTALAGGGVRLSYRIAFPWKYMNRDGASKGDTVYFAAAVNDLDRDQKDLSAISVFEMKKQMPRGFGAVCLE